MDYTKFVYDENGNEVLWCMVVDLMDDEIREQLHAELAPCDEQAFFDAYVREHKKKFNENFNI